MDMWAIVELMGHVRLAGKVTEEERFGAKLGRIDIPKADGTITQYFGGGSVYRLTVVTEDVARQIASTCNAAPIQPWEFPRGRLPAPTAGEEALFNCPDDDEVDEPSMIEGH